jgi:RNA polymerase sigma-70 factor (ECF subfamily)
MARVAAGDRAAFDLLAARHLLRLRRIALRILDDAPAAEDVAQETMLRAWTGAARFDPSRGTAQAWLARIARNLALDQLRRRRPGAAMPEDLEDAAPGAEETLLRRERGALLAAGIAALPARQRTAIALTYGEGQTGAEVARTLAVSTRALEGLLRRGRTWLRLHLNQADGQEDGP